MRVTRLTTSAHPPVGHPTPWSTFPADGYPRPVGKLLRDLGVGAGLFIACLPLLAIFWFLMVQPMMDNVQSMAAPSRAAPPAPPRATVPTDDPPSFVPEPEGTGLWTCGYSPTLNNNWHDDVLCTDGTSRHRPYLRPGDSFITAAELQRAAAAYERRLNVGR